MENNIAKITKINKSTINKIYDKIKHRILLRDKTFKQLKWQARDLWRHFHFLMIFSKKMNFLFERLICEIVQYF